VLEAEAGCGLKTEAAESGLKVGLKRTLRSEAESGLKVGLEADAEIRG